MGKVKEKKKTAVILRLPKGDKKAFERENMKFNEASTPGVKNSSSKHAMVY